MRLEDTPAAANSLLREQAEERHHRTGDELVAYLVRQLDAERRHQGLLMARLEDLRAKYHRLCDLVRHHVTTS